MMESEGRRRAARNEAPGKLHIPGRAISIALFLLLAFLCYQAHQWTRHFTGAALCGGFGTVTFTVATTREPCALPTLLTLSGPVLTYGLEYLGMLLLSVPAARARWRALFGYALIFASFGHMRFIQTLTGRGDELILAQQGFGITSRVLVAFLVFLIGLPPVIAAFRAIANRHRARVFVLSWLLPVPLLFVMLFGDNFLFQTSDAGTRLGAVIGIWTVVLVTDLLALALFLFFASRERGRSPR